MEEDIKKAIELLRQNDYFVTKITPCMDKASDECSETGYGDCMDCPCFVCIAGIE